jgi:hypothetical protein
LEVVRLRRTAILVQRQQLGRVAAWRVLRRASSLPADGSQRGAGYGYTVTKRLRDRDWRSSGRARTSVAWTARA